MGDKERFSASRQVFIKTLRGNIVTMDVEATDTIKNVMEKIQAREGIAPAQQTLIFAATQQMEVVQINSDQPAEESELVGSSELLTQTSDGSYIPDWSQASSIEQSFNKDQLCLVKMDSILSLFRYIIS